MRLVLTQPELLKILHTSLCDGGLNELRYSGVELRRNSIDYAVAKKSLIDRGEKTEDNVCCEDIWVEMVRLGLSIYFKDFEEGNGKVLPLTLAGIKKGFTNPKAIQDVIKTLNPDGDSDAWTGYNLLQYALFNDVIYG